jgi:hypothetical protein
MRKKEKLRALRVWILTGIIGYHIISIRAVRSKMGHGRRRRNHAISPLARPSAHPYISIVRARRLGCCKKGVDMSKIAIFLARCSLVVVLVASPSALLYGQSVTNQSGPPPIAAPLVREGDFAVDLEQALEVGTSTDEIEAESILSQLGIIPRNGWIADYPVTPDIFGELQQAVSNAATSGRLPMNRDEALGRLNNVNAKEGLGVSPYAGPQTDQAGPPEAENYPNPAAVNDYYYTDGPPIVTYYTPPPDYYYLYTWVPYPFFCTGFWFPGFFVLHDFHRHIFFHGRPSFISNHFNDVTAHRVFRVDPRNRFDGRTFGGIGVPRQRSFIGTGVPRSETRIFNAPRNQLPGVGGRPFENRSLSQGRGSSRPNAPLPNPGFTRPNAGSPRANEAIPRPNPAFSRPNEAPRPNPGFSHPNESFSRPNVGSPGSHEGFSRPNAGFAPSGGDRGGGGGGRGGNRR